jgi:2-methylcitrate dehydratase PrpD
LAIQLPLLATVVHRLRGVPDAAVCARARLHLLDWLACVVGARQTAVADVARRAETDVLARAALLGSVLEMDDVHRTGRLHPGPVIWPAALSAARDTGCNMVALLEGAVRGYEAMIAIGASFDAYHYAHWHNTSTAGGFGAAATAATIFALDDAALVSALGNAGSIAGGLWHMRHDDVMTKPMHVAHAVHSGLWQARLARAGLTGPARILEGEQGLYAAMTKAPMPLSLAGNWRIAEVSFKPWAACRHAHPAIDAALALRSMGALAGAVHVETYGDAIRFCDRPDPVTELDAKFSLQHAVAVIAGGGSAGPEDFTVDAIARHAAGRAAVSVALADAIDARYPAHYGARVTASGQTLEFADTLGDPERPLDEAGIRGKFAALAAWGGLDDAALARGTAVVLAGDDPAALVSWLEEVL